jgi:hypothetical protein
MGRHRISSVRVCSSCGSDTTYIGKPGYEQWRIINDCYLCSKCYFRKIINPRTHKFKEKRLVLSVAPRKNVCNRCGNRIGDTYINSQGQVVPTKRTVIHHQSYNSNDVLANSEELCASCHVKTLWTLKRRSSHSAAIKRLWRQGLY